MWTSFNTQESRDGIEVITSDNNRDVQHQVDGLEESEGIIPTAPEWPTEDVVDETEDKHEMIEFGENALPSYNELEDMDIPTYEDLGTKWIQLGSNVFVMDKNFDVSTFKSSSNV